MTRQKQPQLRVAAGKHTDGRIAPGAPASGPAGVEFSQKRAGPEIGAPLLPIGVGGSARTRPALIDRQTGACFSQDVA